MQNVIVIPIRYLVINIEPVMIVLPVNVEIGYSHTHAMEINYSSILRHLIPHNLKRVLTADMTILYTIANIGIERHALRTKIKL